MLTFEQVKELIRLVDETQLESVEVVLDGSAVRVQRSVGASTPTPLAATPASTTSPPAAPSPEAATAPAAPDDPNQLVVTSPIVGTFYAAPSPGERAFVEVGDRVAQGDVMCIVEAMKLMNEIEAPAAGTVEAVLRENAEAVDFGAQLFVIRLDGAA